MIVFESIGKFFKRIKLIKKKKNADRNNKHSENLYNNINMNSVDITRFRKGLEIKKRFCINSGLAIILSVLLLIIEAILS